MQHKELIDSLELEDLRENEELYAMAELIGIENMRNVIGCLGGSTIHIPQIQRIKPCVKKYMMNNLDKKRTQLLVETGLSKQKINEYYKELKIVV